MPVLAFIPPCCTDPLVWSPAVWLCCLVLTHSSPYLFFSFRTFIVVVHDALRILCVLGGGCYVTEQKFCANPQLAQRFYPVLIPIITFLNGRPGYQQCFTSSGPSCLFFPLATPDLALAVAFPVAQKENRRQRQEKKTPELSRLARGGCERRTLNPEVLPVWAGSCPPCLSRSLSVAILRPARLLQWVL